MSAPIRAVAAAAAALMLAPAAAKAYFDPTVTNGQSLTFSAIPNPVSVPVFGDNLFGTVDLTFNGNTEKVDVGIFQLQGPGGIFNALCIDITRETNGNFPNPQTYTAQVPMNPTAAPPGSPAFTAAALLEEKELMDAYFSVAVAEVPTNGLTSEALQIAVWDTYFGNGTLNSDLTSGPLTFAGNDPATNLASQMLQEYLDGHLTDNSSTVAVAYIADGPQNIGGLQPVPEPTTLALLGGSLVGLGAARRRYGRSAKADAQPGGVA